MARIVREDDQTVRNWRKRYLAEGIDGLKERPMPGAPPKLTPAYTEQLVAAVRRRPRSLDQPYSLWTLQRLADDGAEQTGIRVSYATVRVCLKRAGIVLSRPQQTISSPDPEYVVKTKRAKTPVRGSGQATTSTTLTSATGVGSRRCGRDGVRRGSTC
jgi:transposase